jgi:hypothetical protein
MYRQFLEAQMLDISRSPMEVTPTADDGMEIQSVPVPKSATGLLDWEAGGEVQLAGRLLE